VPAGVTVFFFFFVKSRSCTHHWIPSAVWTDCYRSVRMTPNYSHLASNEIVLAWLLSNLIASAGSDEIKKKKKNKDHLRLFFSCRVWGSCIHAVSLNLVCYWGCFISKHSDSIMSCDFIMLCTISFSPLTNWMAHRCGQPGLHTWLHPFLSSVINNDLYKAYLYC
jgi:hypothetical protein